MHRRKGQPYYASALQTRQYAEENGESADHQDQGNYQTLWVIATEKQSDFRTLEHPYGSARWTGAPDL